MAIIKMNLFSLMSNCFSRTVLPAFPAPFAKLRNDHGPLEKMLSHEALKAFGTESQRCYHRLPESVNLGQITVNRYGVFNKRHGFCSHVRGQAARIDVEHFAYG